MAQNRKSYTTEERAKIAMEALKGNMTMGEISSKFGVHATQIANWKNKLKSGMVDIFSEKKQRKKADQNRLVEELYRTIGQQKIEIEWLKKKSELFKD